MRLGVELYESKFVDPTEAMKHLKFLQKKGFGHGTVQARTGISRVNLKRIRAGRRTKITREIEDKILAVPAIPILPGNRLPTAPLNKMLKKLNRKGYTNTDIGRLVGYPDGRLNIKKTMRLEKYRRIEHVCKQLLREIND